MRTLICYAAIVWAMCAAIDPSYWWAQGIGVGLSLLIARVA